MGRASGNRDHCRRFKKKALTEHSARPQDRKASGWASALRVRALTEHDAGPRDRKSPALPRIPALDLAAVSLTDESANLTQGPKNGDWPGWRGANRDARVAWLPESLPETADFDWTAELAGEGLGGIAAASGYVVIGSRDALDQNDVFQCFDMNAGMLIWQHVYPALGKLDYGNSPRATPLIHKEYVYTLGAFGHLCCLEIETGIMMWQVNIARKFDSPKLIWGHSGTPVIVDQKLILQPGGKDASIVALDLETGDVIWTTAGNDPAYSSLLLKSVGDSQQVVGYDARSLGGWDVETGKRLWTLIPPKSGDLNVPTAVSIGDRLLVSSENNGTRVYHFNADGTLFPEPDMTNEDLKPDSHTPVISNGRAFGIWSDFYGLDPERSLKTVVALQDDAFADYCCLIASDTGLLALSHNGELLLIATDEVTPAIKGRLKLHEDRTQLYSHPAIAGDSIYLRIGKTLARLQLDQ